MPDKLKFMDLSMKLIRALATLVVFGFALDLLSTATARETAEAKRQATTQPDAIRLAIAQVKEEIKDARIVETNAELLRPGDQVPMLRDPRAKQVRDILKTKEVWLVKILLSDAKGTARWTEMVFIDSASGKVLFR